MDDARRVALVETRTRDTAGTDKAPRRLIRYQFGNHLDSASLELDDRAQIVSYEEYAPYGSTTYQAVRSRTETPKRYRYTGKERDEETGLNYHGARYYAPWLARWTSADPVVPEDGVDAYAYVSNNPVRFTDPDGQAKPTPLPEGIGFVSDYEDWSSLWKEALTTVLERQYKGGSLAKNQALHDKAILDSIQKFKGSLGSNSQEGTAINLARTTYSSVRTEFDKLAGGRLTGIQIHHAIEELAANPRMALSADNLIFARGQAATEGTLHWMLHEMNRLKELGVKNPGRQAMLNALEHGKISKELVSPTLRAESANAKRALGATEGAAHAEAPPSQLGEYVETTQAQTDVAVEGGTTYGEALKNTKAAFVGALAGDQAAGPGARAPGPGGQATGAGAPSGAAPLRPGVLPEFQPAPRRHRRRAAGATSGA